LWQPQLVIVYVGQALPRSNKISKQHHIYRTITGTTYDKYADPHHINNPKIIFHYINKEVDLF
jgi:hypothetical protein